MTDSMTDMQISGPKSKIEENFCRVPHGELMAKKWLDSIEKQRKRIDWKEQMTDRRTDRVNDKKQ